MKYAQPSDSIVSRHNRNNAVTQISEKFLGVGLDPTTVIDREVGFLRAPRNFKFGNLDRL